jgi:acyl carrier protein
MLGSGPNSAAVTEDEVMSTVRDTITELLERSDREVPVISPSQDLMATGLTSLDLAAVIAILENRWHVDPFLEQVSITEVRTVDDLCRAYHRCLTGPASGFSDEDSEFAAELEQARDRGHERAARGRE